MSRTLFLKLNYILGNTIYDDKCQLNRMTREFAEMTWIG